MMFIMERGETDEERGFVTDGFTWDEARRNRAKFILDIYRVAKIELDDAAGIKKTPFTYEEIFTQEQIDNGVKFEDYLLLITHETALDRAKKKIAIWIDWEHGHDLAPEGDSPRSRADKTAAPARRRSLKRPEKRGQKSGKSGQMA
jgi:hypothetical protein